MDLRRAFAPGRARLKYTMTLPHVPAHDVALPVRPQETCDAAQWAVVAVAARRWSRRSRWRRVAVAAGPQSRRSRRRRSRRRRARRRWRLNDQAKLASMRRAVPASPATAGDQRQLVTELITAGWAVALITLLVLRDHLPTASAGGSGRAPPDCAMGLFGLWYVPRLKRLRARAAQRRAEARSDAAPQAQAAPRPQHRPSRGPAQADRAVSTGRAEDTSTVTLTAACPVPPAGTRSGG